VEASLLNIYWVNGVWSSL